MWANVVLFMSHQDVVPVPEVTINDWKYPPWEGHFDGERIWGRGSFRENPFNNRFFRLQE